eukprot:Seg2480.2 transcript_id=Seg2480.2/GoldUCD/mRNA.D3Y31 product="GRIP1-associated protein 1" protein_id=Seg2480.2/GoldUCD/D3Y31
MAENGGISADEFNRLQTQLIELRTQNYEIAEKYKKTKNENDVLQETVNSKDKELQKVGKLAKLPGFQGFQAFTKNKNKKNYDEIAEENDRLVRQMQRHEEDFNLQNKTLLQEVSRLSAENDTMEAELKKLKDARSRELDENDEMRRIKAENTVLHKKLQDYEVRNQRKEEDSTDNDSTDQVDSKEVDEQHSKHTDIDEYLNSFRETIKTSLSKLISKTHGEHDNDKENAEFSQERSDFIEIIVIEFKDLLKRAPTTRSGSITNNDISVRLETEEAENRLLRDQLKEEREKTRAEIESLKTENEKLTEKAKRKQESYMQLHEEKEKLHKEKRHLEEEWIKTKEQVATWEEKVTELEQKLDVTRQENTSLQQEVIGLREKNEQCSPERLSELEHALQGKNEELSSLKSQLEESSSLNQDMMSEVQKLSDEKNEVEEVSQQNLEVANKRKKLLDELSVERQNELSSHKEELEVSRKENEEQRKQLETRMSELEKAKREITLANDRHAELLKTYTSVDKKAGWLERTLKEAEEQIEQERRNHNETIEQKEVEFKERLESIEEEHLAEIKTMNEAKAEIERERDEKDSVIEKMNQAAKDKEVEHRISSKKGDQLLKDLKRQLKTERKRADQIQQRLQDFLSESKTRQTYDEIFKSDSPFSKGHRRQDSGSHLSTVSSNSGIETSADSEANKTSTPLSGTPLSGGGSDSIKLTSETVELISRVADLQLEKNVLEEKVRHLEENSSTLVEDVMRKTEIIQNYVRDTKPDLHPETVRKRNMTLKEKMKDSLSIGKQGKSGDMLKEMNTKMQRLLEETLEKNIQLEKLGDDAAQYNDGGRMAKDFFLYNKSTARSENFINAREVTGRFSLPPGEYCILPSTFKPSEEGDFLVRMFSEKGAAAGTMDTQTTIEYKPTKPTKEEDEAFDSKFVEFFKKVAGADGEIDAFELQSVLTAVFKKEFNDTKEFSLEACR